VPEDKNEPDKVASAAQRLGLSHVVVTSVTRDDLSDGGARQFATTIEAIRTVMPRSTVEVLIPDFQGAESALKLVIEARPDLLNHNLETVSRLYPKVRQGACYSRSLELFNRCRSIDSDIPTKSGIMVGLGETWEELEQLFLDLVHVGCRALTIGQYLQPTSKHRSVKRFYSPEEFSQLELLARSIGIQEVCSGPLIRSSYGAAELLKQLTSNTD
jgi:lipoic acid synthetase